MSDSDDGRDIGHGWVAYMSDEDPPEEYYYHEASGETVRKYLVKALTLKLNTSSAARHYPVLQPNKEESY